MKTRKRKPWRGTPLSDRQQKAISKAVLVDGKSYRELGDKYGRSRERIRQIVHKLNPGLNRVAVAKYGYCVRCGRSRNHPLPPDRTYMTYFGNENDYCCRCRAALYRQLFVMTCVCCQKTIHETFQAIHDRLKNAKKLKGRSSLEVEKGTLKGRYLCRKCYHKLRKPPEKVKIDNRSPQVVTRCIGCGKERATRLYAVKSVLMRYYPEKHLVLVRCGGCVRNPNKKVDISPLTQRSHCADLIARRTGPARIHAES